MLSISSLWIWPSLEAETTRDLLVLGASMASVVALVFTPARVVNVVRCRSIVDREGVDRERELMFYHGYT